MESDPTEPRDENPAEAAPREDAGAHSAWPGEEVPPAEARWRRVRIVGRYEDFLRCSADWLWETDADLVLTYVSSPVALKLGIPAQVLIGRALPSLGRFEAAGANAKQPDPFAKRRPFRHAPFAMTGADRQEVAYLLSGVPWYDDLDGRFAGFRGTALAAAPPPPATEAGAETGAETADQDLAVLNRTLEEALRRNAELSWRLSRLGGATAPAGEAQPTEDRPPVDRPPEAAPVSLARTAHELRTPLNAVVGYADLGLSAVFGDLGERYLDCFRSIREAGRHMNELVGRLQDPARRPEEAGLAAEAVDIAGAVAKAKAMIALAAREAEVDISRVGPLAGGRAVGDPRACVQILLNLLSNAVKFTPAGGSVGLETIVGPNDTLQVVVWDSGTGIALDEQQKIFEADYRAAEVRREKKIPGLGLGLSISRDLVLAMGGDLSVVSQPGQGSRFILSLPLAAPAAPDG